MTTASICTIGDEILIGQITDTNSAHISRALNSLGIKVTQMLSIGDEHDAIIEGLEGELRKNNIVIVTGGLGPTKDDITKASLAELSCSKGYRTDEAQLEIIRRILSSRGLDLLDINIAQASVPDTCKVIITYHDKKHIQWCNSKGIIQPCILEHQKYTGKQRSSKLLEQTINQKGPRMIRTDKQKIHVRHTKDGCTTMESGIYTQTKHKCKHSKNTAH